MWLAILITVVAASCNNLGKALQKQASARLPKLELTRYALGCYLTNGTWLGGLLTDIAGAVMMIKAYADAPVSVVQPVSGLGLGVLALYSHFFLQERITAVECVAAGVATAGAIGLGLTSSDVGDEEPEAMMDQQPSVTWILSAYLGMVLLFAVVTTIRHMRLAVSARTADEKDKGPGARAHTISLVTGLEAGTCFGLSAGATRTGFMLGAARYGGSALFIPAGIGMSIGLSSAGIFLQNRGLRDGSTLVVATCATVSAMLSGVAVGLGALREAMPRSTAAAIARLVSWAAICAGVSIMATGPEGMSVMGAGVSRALRIPRLAAWMAACVPRRARLWLRSVRLRMGSGKGLPTQVSHPWHHGEHHV